MSAEENKAGNHGWRFVFGKFASPAEIKKTLWDDARVKHDPDDKDWDDSEPDPSAP